MRVILLAVLITGCQTAVTQRESFILSDSRRVTCTSYKQTPCGMKLDGCGPIFKLGMSEEYVKKHFPSSFECLRGVEYVGSGASVPADYAPIIDRD